MSAASPMRIAIVGGGLGGATMANALIELPNFTVDVFEAAAEFSERGAAVGLSIIAQLALDRVMTSGAKKTLDAAGGVAVASSRAMIGSGPKAGTVILDLAGGDPTIVVHRAALLRELFVPIPASALHASKKLRDIVATPSGVELAFEDGTTDTFDVVVGADGIFGSVRKFVLQGDADKHKATPAGFWDSRNLVPIEKAKEKLGEEYFKEPRQYMWCGDGGIVLHDELNDGKVVQCIVSCVEPNPTENRKVHLNRGVLEKVLAKWQDGPIGKGIIDLMLDQDEPQAYSQWEHKSTPTYANGNVCIVGDAAHATTPWQGSGAGLAIEDAVVLAALLKTVASREDIAPALKAFDEIRRPRCQRVIDSSRLTGSICCGQLDGGHDDPEKTKERLTGRWDFIRQFDLDQHIEEALQIMQT